MNLKRIIVLEVEYRPEIDGTPEDFRAMPAEEARAFGEIVHTELVGGAIEPVAGPDGEP
jgi:hypothetical protein